MLRLASLSSKRTLLAATAAATASATAVATGATHGREGEGTAASSISLRGVLAATTRPNWPLHAHAAMARASCSPSAAAAAAAEECCNDDGGTGALTATFTTTDGPTTTTSQSFSSSPSSLVVPTLQAALRAARLVGTVSLVAYDYQSHGLEKRIREKVEASSSVLPPSVAEVLGLTSEADFNREREIESHEGDADDDAAFVEGVDGNSEEERLYWEKMVERRTEELERAQVDYTTMPEPREEDGEEDGDSIEEVSGEEAAREAARRASWRKQSQENKRRAVHEAARLLTEAEERLDELGGSGMAMTHRRAATRLLHLCRSNGGVYIKVGQHLANLDYLVPPEYVDVLSSLFDDAPVSPYSDVREVVREDLGAYPEELFDSFSPIPLASASLAQVHVAYDRETGEKLAVKVQHRGLRETSRGDTFALTMAVRAVEMVFRDFTWGWLVDEIAPQLPKELDFHNEGRNSELAASHLADIAGGIDCVVPKVLWDKTTDRVLCMHFEEGFRSTDLGAIDEAGLKRSDVATLISRLFNSQVFQSGFVHCDPHPANVLLRNHPTKKGKPQIVLVDHGLYKQIDDEFRITYARLWRSLMMADIQGIKDSCEKLGVTEMYPLLAAMLTSRPFDELLERSKTGNLSTNSATNNGGHGDKSMIRGYAQRYMKEIIAMLDTVPRQMLLLFKMNDCLRHVDFALGSPANTLVVAGEVASRAVFEEEQRQWHASVLHRLASLLDYWRVSLRIRSFELVSWWMDTLRKGLILDR